MTPFLTYLTCLAQIHAGGAGTAELSFRAALELLLNCVGDELDAPLDATHEIAASGGGDGSGRLDLGISDNLPCVVSSTTEEITKAT